MSTFDGRVKEFPDVRIDYFRPSQDEKDASPLAYFLSHVHSDHLTGLESCRSPFIYCSPATRDILLRLEKYPHRMNFAKGILESRQQTYRHLKKLLKAIPLETPTVIELGPLKQIRATLFDANHCVGAVGFLIEGDGKAVFYTGDVRSEAWWVDSLVRSPVMVPFTGEHGRRLDCIYLDTTFATTAGEGRYRDFPSKAEGLRELVTKVRQYPDDTLFYYDSWTFGYEDVWQTLSTILDTRIHVDDYRYGLYRCLKSGAEPRAPEATKLVGFNFGNHYQEGCLTDQWTRLHSCEQGTGCKIWEKPFVRITPIISRHHGVEMRELGAGGGKGDLNPKHELEFGDAEMMLQMLEAPGVLSSLWKAVAAVMDRGTQALDLDVAALGLQHDSDSQAENPNPMEDLSIDKLLPALAQWLQKGRKAGEDVEDKMPPEQPAARIQDKDTAALPQQITFPYSRHSSYRELCLLIVALKPKDIHPCTVDSAHWHPSQSMEALFGHLYEEDEAVSFTHDELMMQHLGEGVDLQPYRPYRKRRRESTSPVREAESPERDAQGEEEGVDEEVEMITAPQTQIRVAAPATPTPPTATKRTRVELDEGEASFAYRQEVHDAAIGARGRRWGDVELVSVNGHQKREVEL